MRVTDFETHMQRHHGEARDSGYVMVLFHVPSSRKWQGGEGKAFGHQTSL